MRASLGSCLPKKEDIAAAHNRADELNLTLEAELDFDVDLEAFDALEFLLENDAI